LSKIETETREHGVTEDLYQSQTSAVA